MKPSSMWHAAYCTLAISNSFLLVADDTYHLDVSKMNQEIFSCIYEVNAWLDPDTRSGPGSNLKQTAIIRTELPKIFKELGIEILLDVPCGDFYFMDKTDLSCLKYYIGGDIVPQIIVDVRKKYASDRRAFMCIDITRDELPKADAILCRDCLPHLSYNDIKAAIKNFKASGARYLITSTYPGRAENSDLNLAQGLNLWRYRPLNFELPPFSFPKPLLIINEGNTESGGGIRDKSLGVWLIQDLPNY